MLQINTGKIIQSFQDSWDQFVAQIPAILLAILIIAAGVFVAGKLAGLSRTVINHRTQDPLMTNFLSKTIKLILVVLVLMVALRVAGLQGIANTLLTAAGASAVIIGFAFRDIGENFISGIILSFQRPFNINDTIQVGDIFGKVQGMEFRYTKVKTFDGRTVYVPNSDVLKKPLSNYTEHGYYRWDFIAGIAYEDDAEAAQQLILKTVNDTDGVVNDASHETFAVVDALSTSTVNLKTFFWVKTIDFRKEALKVRGEVIANVKAALEENGFSMPADIQEIKLYGSQQSIPVNIQNMASKNNETIK